MLLMMQRRVISKCCDISLIAVFWFVITSLSIVGNISSSKDQNLLLNDGDNGEEGVDRQKINKSSRKLKLC